MENKYIKKEKKTLKNFVLPIFLCVIACLLYSIMHSYLFDRQIISTNGRILINLLLMLVAFTWSLFGTKQVVDRECFSITGIASFFFCQTVFSTIINYSLYPSLFSVFNTQTFWFICFLIFIRCSNSEFFRINLTKNLLMLFFWVYSLNYSSWIINRSVASQGLINALYFGLMLIPTVFLSKNVIFRVLAICISALNTLLSGKRTAFFVLLMALITPVLVELFSKKKKELFVTTIITTIALFSLYGQLVGTFEINLFTRIKDMAVDGGSGRLDIYIEIWDLFKRSDFFSKLFGHGFNAVYLNSSVGTSAHNDFLEVLYDFGIMGLGIYVVFISKLITGAFKLYKVKSKFAPMYLSALVSFLIMSTTSHLILYPTYIVFLLLFFVIGIWDLNRILKEEKT